MSNELLELSALEQAALVQRREVSALELARASLSRIDEAAALNAVVYVDPETVLANAAQADARVRNGDRAPLLGVPFSIKDSIAVRGWPWRSGSFAREDVVADGDATVVARLRDAGAIPLCKTATPEYTWSAQTSSALHGYTNNPYDLLRSTGGSSGGEAALHAVGGAAFGLGTDGFCSIRVPAHFCGTTGLRPTSGVVSEAGTWPATRATGMFDISTTGPMARHASDLATVLSIIAGTDPQDPFVHPLAPSHVPEGPLVVGVLPDEAIGAVSEGTRAALRDALEALRAGGAVIRPVEPWHTDDAVDLAFALMAPDSGRGARRRLQSAGGRHTPEFAGLLDALAGTSHTIDEYLEVVVRWSELRTHVRTSLQGFDAVIAPVASGPAPLHDRLPGVDDAESSNTAFNHSFAIAMAGVPSAVIPIRMEAGLPVGVQLLAGPHRDLALAAIAARVQRACRDRIAPPRAWKKG